jgi:hypothetical protein
VDADPSPDQVGEAPRCTRSDFHHLSLDDAIRDAHAAGYNIGSVSKTRGSIPVRGPQPLPPKDDENK